MIAKTAAFALLVLMAANSFAGQPTQAPLSSRAKAPSDTAIVATYASIQGFNHVVGDKRFVGYADMSAGNCKVNVIIATADDDRLVNGTRQVSLDIPAAGRTELEANPTKALGIACTADADAIKVVTLDMPITKAASR